LIISDVTDSFPYLFTHYFSQICSLHIYIYIYIYIKVCISIYKSIDIYTDTSITKSYARLCLHVFIVLSKQLSDEKIRRGLNVWLFSLRCCAFGFWKQSAALAAWSLTSYRFWRHAIQSLFTVTSMEKLTS